MRKLDGGHDEQSHRVPEWRVQLGHELEVHTPDAGEHGGHCDDRHPGGDLPHVVVLTNPDLGEVGLEDRGQQVAVLVDLLHHAGQVVGDVAEVGVQRLRNLLEAVPLGQLLERLEQGMGRPVELEHLPLQVVDALRGVVPSTDSREDLLLDLLDVVVEPIHDRQVVVHHLVENPVEHGTGAKCEQVGAVLDPLPHPRETGGRPVAHRNDELPAQVEGDLAEVDDFICVDIACRLEHHEQGVVVDLELGPLVTKPSVFDGEFVEVELGGHCGELLLGRFVEADPGEDVRVATGVARTFEDERLLAAFPVDVERLIDDHPSPPGLRPQSRDLSGQGRTTDDGGSGIESAERSGDEAAGLHQPAATDRAPLLLGEPSPNAEALVAGQGVVEALLAYRAADADPLGHRDLRSGQPGLSRREEELGCVPGARCQRPPLRDRGNLLAVLSALHT